MNASRLVPATLLTLALLAAPSFAGSFEGSDGSRSSFNPEVPVSAFARPASWLDPSRLHLSASLSVGSGFGTGVQALQVTTLSYDFGAPLSMSVSLGNNLSSGFNASRGSFFLQGLDAAYRPFRNMQFQVHYRNYRSPLQTTPGGGFGYWSP
jgi:hypothetical protein